MSEIKVGDFIKVNKVGITAPYIVESIKNDVYIVSHTEGTYTHRMKLKPEEVSKL